MRNLWKIILVILSIPSLVQIGAATSGGNQNHQENCIPLPSPNNTIEEVKATCDFLLKNDVARGRILFVLDDSTINHQSINELMRIINDHRFFEILSFHSKNLSKVQEGEGD